MSPFIYCRYDSFCRERRKAIEVQVRVMCNLPTGAYPIQLLRRKGKQSSCCVALKIYQGAHGVCRNCLVNFEKTFNSAVKVRDCIFPEDMRFPAPLFPSLWVGITCAWREDDGC